MKKLTIELAEEVISQLQQFSNDDKSDWDNEDAHQKEDELMQSFIQCVAHGLYEIDEAVQVANIIKQAKEIPFARWYA